MPRARVAARRGGRPAVQLVAPEATRAQSLRFTREQDLLTCDLRLSRGCVGAGGEREGPPHATAALRRSPGWHHPCELKLAALIPLPPTTATRYGRKRVARAVPLSRRENGLSVGSRWSPYPPRSRLDI